MVQIILGIMSVNLDGLEHTLGNYSSQKGNECFSGAHLLSLSCFSVLWLIDAGSRTSVALCTLTSHVYSFWKEHLHKSNDADVTGPFWNHMDLHFVISEWLPRKRNCSLHLPQYAPFTGSSNSFFCFLTFLCSIPSQGFWFYWFQCLSQAWENRLMQPEYIFVNMSIPPHTPPTAS